MMPSWQEQEGALRTPAPTPSAPGVTAQDKGVSSAGVGPERAEPLDRKGHLQGKSKEGGLPREQTPRSQREESPCEEPHFKKALEAKAQVLGLRKFCEHGPRRQPRAPREQGSLKEAPGKETPPASAEAFLPGGLGKQLRSPLPPGNPGRETLKKAQTQRPWQRACSQVLTHLVQVFESQHDLACIHAHLGLLEVLALVEVGEHLATIHIVWEAEWRLGSIPHGWPQWPPGPQAWRVPALTQDEVQLGIGLESVVQRDQEGRLAHQLQH